MFIITREMLKVASNAERCRLFRMIIAGLAVYEKEKGVKHGKG